MTDTTAFHEWRRTRGVGVNHPIARLRVKLEPGVLFVSRPYYTNRAELRSDGSRYRKQWRRRCAVAHKVSQRLSRQGFLVWSDFVDLLYFGAPVDPATIATLQWFVHGSYRA